MLAWKRNLLIAGAASLALAVLSAFATQSSPVPRLNELKPGQFLLRLGVGGREYDWTSDPPLIVLRDENRLELWFVPYLATGALRAAEKADAMDKLVREGATGELLTAALEEAIALAEVVRRGKPDPKPEQVELKLQFDEDTLTVDVSTAHLWQTVYGKHP